MDDVSRPPLIVVSCYTDHSSLAHRPRGTESSRSLQTFRLNMGTGQLTLLSVVPATGDIVNPAFSRFAPGTNMLYTCSELLHEDGEVFAYRMSMDTGKMSLVSKVGAGGTSTCYITLDHAQRNMLLVNYWDSTLTSLPILPGGALDPVHSTYRSGKGTGERSVSHDNHVDHASNDASAIAERQSEPHLHALILDRELGRLAFVPDLGMDLIRQFYYDPNTSALIPTGVFPSGPKTLGPHGPRYIELHPQIPVAYVVNELGSNITVFRVDRQAIRDIVASKGKIDTPALSPIQTISTIPDAFSRELNTCGRVCVHPSGLYVVVSNRGHDSLAVYRISARDEGRLTCVGFFHTTGMTPRHFQFDPTSGQWLVVANQDTDSVAVFRFNMANGGIEYTGLQYKVSSPNFVCFCSNEVDENTSARPARL